MNKSLQGILAWMGCWISMCAIADYVIEFESRAYTMAFGVLAYFIAESVRKWIKT